MNKNGLEENGGKENQFVARVKRETELLSTKFIIEDKKGNYVFRAFSPNGLLLTIVLLESLKKRSSLAQRSLRQSVQLNCASPASRAVRLRGNDLIIFGAILVLAMAAPISDCTPLA